LQLLTAVCAENVASRPLTNRAALQGANA